MATRRVKARVPQNCAAEKRLVPPKSAVRVRAEGILRKKSMRRVIATALFTTLAAAGAVHAETWKGYSAVSANNLQWSYDADYSYRDAKSQRVVALSAVGKVAASPRMGPSAPGAADGVGSVVALDCKAQTILLVSGYSPKKPLAIPDDWRSAPSKKVESAEDKALLAAVCTGAENLPVK